MTIENRGNEIVAIFTQSDKTIVPFENGYVVVELDVLLNDGDIVLAPYGNGLYRYSTKDPGNGKGDRIIATYGMSKLEGVPMIVNGDIERLATTAVINKIGKYGLEHSTGMLLKSMFIEGYNLHSQTHEYTRADVEMAIEMALDMGNRNIYEPEKILQSLQVPERLELPVEEETFTVNGMDDQFSHVEYKYKLKHENGIIYI